MIEVLGDIRLSIDGRARTIGSRSQRLVLAVLAAHVNRVVTADALIDALWEDYPPATARRTLGSYVSRLRATLGDAVEIGHGGHRLVADANSLDSARFEQLIDKSAQAGPALALDLLERALRLNRGPAFGEFADLDAVRGAAMRLETLMLDAREAHAAALWRVGRVSDAAAAASEIVAEHPLREAAWTVLIDAQSRSSPGEALRTYRRAVVELADVGLVPSAALREAEARALLGESRHDPAMRPLTRIRGRNTLIGRDDALVELGVLMQSHRLVTLVGPGGVGKTRLANEIAIRHQSEHRLGARVVSLGEVSEPEAVAAAIVEELDIGGVDASPAESLTRAGNLDVLLIIDNCEHVIDAAAVAIEAILDGGDATIIATSRQRLGVDGERVWTTAPLGRRGNGVGDAFDVELFVDRAEALGIDVTADRDVVERIVERLDGLPLAIEMAAATLSSHGLADLETQTQSDPSILRAPSRGVPSRQRTLASLVDWSLDDLDDTTRRAAVQLSVFDAAFDPSGAAAVIGDTSPTIVHDLVDRSLLAADTTSGHARYRMLWTIKSQVRRRGSDEQLATGRRRHAVYHLDRLIADDVALRTVDEGDADRRISDAYPELRSAHLWSTEHDAEVAARISVHLHVWAMSRQIGDPFRWAERLISGTTTAPPAVVASLSQAWFYSGRIDDAIEAVEAALVRADGTARLLLLESLGDIVLAQGDLERARTLGEQLTSAAEAVGDNHFVVIGRCAQALAHGYATRTGAGLELLTELDAAAPTDQGWIGYTVAELTANDHPEHAAELLNTAIEAADSVRNRFLAGVARVSLSSLRAQHGDPTASVRDLTETIEHWQRRGMHAYLLTSLRNLVVLLDRLDQPALAVRLIGAIDGAARLPSYGTERAHLIEVADRARDRLGHELYARLYDQSRVAPFDRVTADVIGELRQLAT